MKMTFARIPVLLLSLSLLTQCRPDPIDIDVPPAEKKLVVASQIVPNSIMVVGLSRSFSALDPEGHQDTLGNNFLDKILVAGGIVTVDHPGGTDTLFMVTPGIYASTNVLLTTSGVYTLHAKDTVTGKEITATTELLAKETFDSIRPYFKTAGADTAAFIHYELKDHPGEDYYVVCYYRKTQNKGIFDLNSYFQPGTNELNSFDLVNDQDFDQSGKLIRDQQLLGVGTSDTIAVTVSHITKGYYGFLTAYKRSGKLFNQLTGEPINYPTNVQGGYGYFNTHFPDVRIFKMEDFK